MMRCRMNVLVVAAGLMPAPATVLAADPIGQVGEYQVKAAFLYNFAKFVVWPDGAFRNAGEPFSICVLGDDPFGRSLDDVVAGKRIGARTVNVRRISEGRQTAGCHILFISSRTDKKVYSALAVEKLGSLVFSPWEMLAIPLLKGVMISFIMENGKVRFEINTAVADGSGLHISSKLMSLAQANGKKTGAYQ